MYMESSRMLHRALYGMFFITLAAITLSADAPMAAGRLMNAEARRHDPIKIHHIRDGIVSSTNWSGYAVTGAPGSVTDVKASWTVPAIQGSCPSTNQYSSFWVGIDGYSDNSVEQIGTDSDCQNGAPTYYAWFEFYPHPMFIINSLTVNPGDTISAEVKYSGKNQFTVSISDVNTGQSFSTTTRVNAQRSSAEWIAEAPSSAGGVLPLADFGTAYFGLNYTAVASTSYATVGGKTSAIGSFGSSVQEITMVTPNGTIKAQPSGLSSDGTSFSDAWWSAGP